MSRKVTASSVGALLGVFVLVLTGCNPPSSPATTSEKAVSPAIPAPPAPIGAKPSEIKADFPPMSAEDYVKEFIADEQAAAKKFKDKKVVVEGVIVEKEGDGDKAATLYLAGHKSDTETINLQCGLAVIDDYTAAEFKKLKVGDKVKINGEGEIFGGITRKKDKPAYVGLIICKIVK